MMPDTGGAESISDVHTNNATHAINDVERELTHVLENLKLDTSFMGKNYFEEKIKSNIEDIIEPNLPNKNTGE